MSFRISVILLLIMVVIGICFGGLFYLIIMPMVNGQLIHCVLLGIAFGLINYFVTIYFYKKYDDLKNTNLFLEQNLRKDKLTDLLNRRAFENDIEEFNNKSCSVIFIDIDGFREYNNKFGHHVGDMILKRVGSSVKQAIREGDLAYRYGGEEFVLILPQSNKETAFKIAERIRESVSAQDISPYPNVNISLGISNFPEDGQTFSEVLGYSDMALLSAKSNGKNKTVIFNSNILF